MKRYLIDTTAGHSETVFAVDDNEAAEKADDYVFSNAMTYFGLEDDEFDTIQDYVTSHVTVEEQPITLEEYEQAFGTTECEIFYGWIGTPEIDDILKLNGYTEVQLEEMQRTIDKAFEFEAKIRDLIGEGIHNLEEEAKNAE